MLKFGGKFIKSQKKVSKNVLINKPTFFLSSPTAPYNQWPTNRKLKCSLISFKLFTNSVLGNYID